MLSLIVVGGLVPWTVLDRRAGTSALLADEPTGNLDSQSGAEVIALLQSLNRERGITVVLVTHDLAIARHASRIVHLHDGRVARDEPVLEPTVTQTLRKEFG